MILLTVSRKAGNSKAQEVWHVKVDESDAPALAQAKEIRAEYCRAHAAAAGEPAAYEMIEGESTCESDAKHPLVSDLKPVAPKSVDLASQVAALSALVGQLVKDGGK